MIRSVHDFDAIRKRLRELGGGPELTPNQEKTAKKMCMHGSLLEECVACCSKEAYRGLLKK